jgi:hypothetical protein
MLAARSDIPSSCRNLARKYTDVDLGLKLGALSFEL